MYSLSVEVVTLAALLLAWCGVANSDPVEGRVLGAIVVGVVAVGWAAMADGRRTADANRRLAAGRWWGLDAAVRHAGTSIALGASLALCLWAAGRAEVGAKLGGAGSLLVLLLVTAVGAKLVAETYLFAQIGGDESPRQHDAKRLTGVWSGWAKTRYLLAALGGVILPLGAQLLAGGSKNIPAVVDAGPPAALAMLSLALLLPGEAIERWL
ncbi:MAG: hypothetical protein AAF805_12510, partial [Planctomycetota bacterium]